MATSTAPTPTVSAWSKPGAWALEAEKDDAEQAAQQLTDSAAVPQVDLDLFPSLSTAVSVKGKKKNKGQTFSLSEFNNGAVKVTAYQPKVGLNSEDLMSLPTGPRERSAEEIERARGRGFSGYGGGSREESGGSRWGGGERREREPRTEREPLGPSRADEADDWGAMKKNVSSFDSGKRERGVGGGFFEGSQSKADESDNWASSKKNFDSMPVRRGFGGGSGGGFGDREREPRRSGFGFDGANSNGNSDAESWGRKKDESNGHGGSGSESGGRQRLVLKPRSVVSNEEEKSTVVAKSKGANPFGEARPREEVLAEKGQDVKEIDEQLDAIKIKEVVLVEPVVSSIPSSGKNPFGDARPREEVLAKKGQGFKKSEEEVEVVPAASSGTPVKIKEAVVAPAASNGTPFGMKSFAAIIAKEDKTQISWRKAVSSSEIIASSETVKEVEDDKAEGITEKVIELDGITEN